MSNRRVPDRLAESGAIRRFVAVRPAGSDEGASNDRRSRSFPPYFSLSLGLRRSSPAPRLEGGLSVNRAFKRVSALPNRHHHPCSAANGWRTIRLSSRRQSLNRHEVKTPARRCDPSTGATLRRRCRGWSGSREPRLAGLRHAPCSDDRTPARGHADLPYLQGSSGGPPAIVAPSSPPTRLAPGTD